MVTASATRDPRALVSALPDPEIPVLTLGDLGIIRGIEVREDSVTVEVTPTYSACPATEAIEASIRGELERHGYPDVRIKRLLSPAWTTDWISAEGRRKLKAFGIAPPSAAGRLRGNDMPVACPRCDSTSTTRVSEFGSTPCKAAFKCNDCLEPFEYFKCL